MATEVTFDPQGTPTGVIDTYYKAQDQRMSMMERSQSLKRQKLAQQLDEQKLAQWQVEAPLRQKQFDANLAESGNKLYAQNYITEKTLELNSKGPEFIKMMDEADVVNVDKDGDNDYNNNYLKWSRIASALSPYSSTAKGKQMIDQANFNQTKFAVLNANMMDLKEKRLVKQTRLLAMQQKPERPVTPQDITDLQEAGVDTSGMQMNNTYRLTYDPATGKPIAWSQPSMINRASDEQGDVAMFKEQGQQRAQKASQFLNDIDTAAGKATERRAIIGNIIDLYKRGAITGAGTAEINTIRGYLVRAGVADPDSLATDEQVEAFLDRIVVEDRREFGKGTGALSDGETAMFVRATANPNRQPATNMAILAFIDEAMERAEKLQQYALNLRIENPKMSDYEIHVKTLEERRKMPLKSAQRMFEASAPKRNQSTSRQSGSVAQPQFDSQSLIQQARKNVQGQ